MKKILKYCFNTTLWSPTRSEWINLLACLPNSERENVTRYVHKQDSKQTLIGQILIRHCLKILLNIDTNHLVIDRNSKGRPFLKIKESIASAKLASQTFDVDFNVSHAGDYTIICAGLFAFANGKKGGGIAVAEDWSEDGWNNRIGTDIMKISIDRSRSNSPNDSNEELFRKELDRHERIINSKFTDAEKLYIYNRPNIVESLTAFYRLWCLKESYVKALGDGVGFDLKRLECVPNSELLIDLNGKKYLVVNDTQLLVDNKLVKTCKYYEQYYMYDFLSKEQGTNQHKHELLHIMTVCLVEKETSNTKSSKAASAAAPTTSSSLTTASSEIDEFVQVGVKDLISTVAPLLDLEECLNSLEEFEDLWQKFCQKQEK